MESCLFSYVWVAAKRGVVVVLVPLLGLGSNQVEKSITADHKVKAYHIDEHRRMDPVALRDRIYAIDDDKNGHYHYYALCISFLLADNKLSGKPSPWICFIRKIVDHGHMSLFCIDKARYVQQNGGHFRPEFLMAINNIKLMVESSRIFTPIIIMSATVCSIDRTTVAVRLGIHHPTVIHGPLSQRGTMIKTIMSENPSTTIKSSTTDKFQNDDHNGIES